MLTPGHTGRIDSPEGALAAPFALQVGIGATERRAYTVSRYRIRFLAGTNPTSALATKRNSVTTPC